MSDPIGKKLLENPHAADIPCEEYERARREGAFVSPCGTEGCQWDGFPEPPDAPADEKEPE